MASVQTGHEGGASQEVDLNLAPILDCFVVIITFLLVSASFLVLGVLDAGIAAGGKSATNSPPPPIQITVEVTATKDLVVKLSGASSQVTRIPAAKSATDPNPALDFPGLAKRLDEVHKRWPTVNAATLTAGNAVEYRDVVLTMDATRKVLPVVLLGGF
jgi:biopolymer transport protein ExbD